MNETRDLVSGLNPVDQWARVPPPSLPNPNVQAPQQFATPAPQRQADPLAPVMAKIASGESGGPDPYHELYGGGQFGFPSWAGASTPQGETHAAGKYQFEPNTWKRAAQEWMAANPGQPAPDFNKPQDQESIARFHAQNIYRQKTGRDLVADATAGKVDYKALAGEWPSLDPAHPMLSSWSSEDRQRHQDQHDSSLGMAREYMRLANEELPGSKERAQLLMQARDEAHKATEAFNQIAKTPPLYKPNDIMQNFGSVAVLLSVLGGMFAKRPFTASLAAAGQAMQAQNQQNYDQFKIANEQWHTQAQLGLDQVKLAHDEIKEVLDDERLEFNEKQARLQSILQGYQMGEQARWHDIEYQHMLNQDRLANYTRGVEAVNRQMGLNIFNELQAARSLPDEDPTKAQKISDAETRLSDWNKKEGKGLNLIAQQSAKLDEDTLNEMADEYIAGNRMVTTRLGMGAIGSQNRAAFSQALNQRMKNRGFSPEDVALRMAEFEGTKSAERTLGTRAANIGMAISEVQQFAPLAAAASDKVDRTKYPTLNAMLLAYEKGTGDENVVALGNYTQALLNAYTAAVVRTGGTTEGAQDRAHKILDPAWSRGQFAAGIQAILTEMGAMSQAPAIVGREIESRFRTGGGAASAIAPPATSVPSAVATLPEGVPSGSKQVGTKGGHPVYKAPDGSLYQVQ